jgi:hypothetical protein
MSAAPLVALALNEIGADVPTTQSLMRIAVVLATAVNKMAGLKGLAKQTLVLDALREVLATPMIANRMDDTAKAVLAEVVNNIIPQTLTLVVEAGRSGALKKPTVGCVASFCSFFCRSAAGVATAANAPPAVADALSAAAAVATIADVVEPDNVQVDPVAETTAPPASEPEPTSASAEMSPSPEETPVEQ